MRTWKGWYAVPDQPLRNALLDAKMRAQQQHRDTSLDAMMTPQIKRMTGGIKVLVVGKPD